jgi:hypothetical protein
MGIKLSSVCCAYCNARLPTEEDEFTGIRSEVKQKHKKEMIPLPFQDYLNRKKSESENDLSLHFLESRKFDYFNSDNRTMNLSAILKIQEIPSPSDGFLNDFHIKERRSFSLHERKKEKKEKQEKLQLFLPNQRKSLDPRNLKGLNMRKNVNISK